ncbi:MAG: hypothetical protein LBI66_06555 [Burkholderiaceae bacterium]|jgi:hypothetical protein|nr:hypothetical protein [Burkholderiaceae bacterium]
MSIICLHTAQSNAEIFAQAAAEQGWPPGMLRHLVREDLLVQAEADGGMRWPLRQRTARLLGDLAAESRGVLLTCSTLGPAVADEHSGKVRRADAMLATEVAQALASDAGSRMVLLCAAPTTHEATWALFVQALDSQSMAPRLQLQCVADAWTLFRRGDGEGYVEMMTEAALQAYADGATQVVLTQVSMEGVARRWPRGCDKPAPWTVAGSALRGLDPTA